MQHIMKQAGASLEVADGELEYLVEVSALAREGSTLRRDAKPDGGRARRSSATWADRLGAPGAAPSHA